MAASQYLPFGIGGVPGAPNTLSFPAYSALTTLRGNGFQPGIAKSEEINTVLRQVSVGVAGLAKLIADHGPQDALDNGSVSDFKDALRLALDALYVQDLSDLVQRSEFTGGNQALSAAGYQKMPGGLILQWGSVAIADIPAGAGYSATIPFADHGGIQFPNSCFRVYPAIEATGAQDVNVSVAITGRFVDRFSFKVQEWSSSTNPISLAWLALGR